MRNLLLSLVLATTGACAARATHPNLPIQYSCGSASFYRAGDELKTPRSDAPSTLSWHDGEGDHFIIGPVAPTDVEATELVVPNDPRQDATQKLFDTTKGPSTADWRLVNKQVCTAVGGYTDVLTRFMRGATLDDITAELSLSDKDEAREIVHQALQSATKRYMRDH